MIMLRYCKKDLRHSLTKVYQLFNCMRKSIKFAELTLRWQKKKFIRLSLTISIKKMRMVMTCQNLKINQVKVMDNIHLTGMRKNAEKLLWKLVWNKLMESQEWPWKREMVSSSSLMIRKYWILIIHTQSSVSWNWKILTGKCKWSRRRSLPNKHQRPRLQ